MFAARFIHAASNDTLTIALSIFDNVAFLCFKLVSLCSSQGADFGRIVVLTNRSIWKQPATVGSIGDTHGVNVSSMYIHSYHNVTCMCVGNVSWPLHVKIRGESGCGH